MFKLYVYLRLKISYVNFIVNSYAILKYIHHGMCKRERVPD